MRNIPAAALLALAVLAAEPSSGNPRGEPPEARTPVVFSTLQGMADTIWFGQAEEATEGADGFLGETEFPPIPPLGLFDVRFVNRPGREQEDTPRGLGQGTRADYRHPGGAGADTHAVHFQPGPGGFPALFRWNPEDLWWCDSAVMTGFPGASPRRLNMKKESRLEITQGSVSSFLILVHPGPGSLSRLGSVPAGGTFLLEGGTEDTTGGGERFILRIPREGNVRAELVSSGGHATLILFERRLGGGTYALSLRGAASGFLPGSLVVQWGAEKRSLPAGQKARKGL
ncbi:MAG: hypothetical protein WB626_01345 [Bacteroidota bacterium]